MEDGLEFLKRSPYPEELETLNRAGLGHIQIGQRATHLIWWGVQRIKLAKELPKRALGKTVYILDEPTTGLHFHDIKQLLVC